MSDTNVGIDADANANIQVDQSQEVETKARRLGWVPKEDFRGDPTRWKPADEFLAHGEEILPILRQNNETLHDRLAKQERDLGEAKQVLLEMREFNRRNEQRIKSEARSEVEAEMRAAVETADTQRFDAAQARMKAIEAPPSYQPNAGQAPPQRPYVEPAVQQWVADNPWFNNDPVLNTVAQAIHVQLGREKPGLSLSDNLAEVTREVRARFPEKFGVNVRRSDASAVATPGGAPAPRRTNKRTFDDLPQEAKDAYFRFNKMMDGKYSKDEYLAQYVWD
jgi:hypothetical protein